MSIPNDDFLAFTLANPTGLTASSFSFPSGTAFLQNSGILRFEPERPAAVSLVLSVGIHGNETGPIELVNRLVTAILTGQISLVIRLLVIIGHPVAANLGRRFCEVNLNRLFRGSWQEYKGFESQRAQTLEYAVNDFFKPTLEDINHIRLHYDLHTAIRGSEYEKFAVHPFVADKIYDQIQLAFLAASGIDAVLLSHQATTTFSYYSYAEHKAHAFTIELGKVYPFGHNDLTRFSALNASLILLMEKAKFAGADIAQMQLFKVLDTLVKDDESYELGIARDVKNFTQFNKEYLLAHSQYSDYRIAQSGDGIVFPNAEVPVGQRAGLVVRPITVEDLTLR